jgi:uncharacterized protein (DUF305 family)
MILYILIILVLICICFLNFYELFDNDNVNINYPCRTVLSDEEFLKHMIPHHQMAIDISIQHIKNTKNDIILKVLRELIWTQQYEIILMLAELKHKTEKISEIYSNKPFIQTISSNMYPNVLGLTKTYCDPAFFNSNQHKNHNVVTDKDYILHMIPHHQVAIDMCKMLLKTTKSDILIYLCYRLIRAQEAEIILLNDLLKSPYIE